MFKKCKIYILPNKTFLSSVIYIASHNGKRSKTSNIIRTIAKTIITVTFLRVFEVLAV